MAQPLFAVQKALKRTQDAALERLTVAATEGDLDSVRNLLARGLPINKVRCYHIHTCLLKAVPEFMYQCALHSARGCSVNGNAAYAARLRSGLCCWAGFRIVACDFLVSCCCALFALCLLSARLSVTKHCELILHNWRNPVHCNPSTLNMIQWWKFYIQTFL